MKYKIEWTFTFHDGFTDGPYSAGVASIAVNSGYYGKAYGKWTGRYIQESEQ